MSTETIELDFGDVKEFAPIARNVEPGAYVFKVAKIELTESKAKNPMWVVDAEFVEGRYAGQTIREYLTLTENALFKVKSFLEAQGLNVGKKKVKLPNTTPALTKAFGNKLFGGHVDDGDTYVNAQGEEVTRSEIKYHLTVNEVRRIRSQAPAEAVTAPTPEPETSAPAEESTETNAEEATDVADQLESFDLDAL